MKTIVPLLLTSTFLYAVAPIKLPEVGVAVTYKDLNEKTHNITIKREIAPICSNIAVTEDNFWGGNAAHKSIPSECKKTFITTRGVIQPIEIFKGIKTVGEIEVLDFINSKSSKFPSKYALVDTRGNDWFLHSTIPSAINVPHNDLKEDEFFMDEYYEALEKLGIKVVDDELDFTNAKNIILFCNGTWCPQSSKAIHQLINIDYPLSKIQWYRGGLQDWMDVGLTTTKK